MLILVSGGCKNGKSSYAQQMAKALCEPGRPLYYVATMTPVDDEDEARIARHRQERAGWGFTTVEQPHHIERVHYRCDPGGSYLIDSATALLANAMFSPGGEVNTHAPEALCAGFAALLPKLRHAVVVSDYLYGDAALYDPLTESYRKGLAQVDRCLAELCDVVIEVAFGNLCIYKGRDLFESAWGGMAL